jgi:hypothetical protein
MLIRLIISPADENRSGANQMRQHLSLREHFRRGNAPSHRDWRVWVESGGSRFSKPLAAFGYTGVIVSVVGYASLAGASLYQALPVRVVSRHRIGNEGRLAGLSRMGLCDEF